MLLASIVIGLLKKKSSEFDRPFKWKLTPFKTAGLGWRVQAPEPTRVAPPPPIVVSTPGICDCDQSQREMKCVQSEKVCDWKLTVNSPCWGMLSSKLKYSWAPSTSVMKKKLLRLIGEVGWVGVISSNRWKITLVAWRRLVVLCLCSCFVLLCSIVFCPSLLFLLFGYSLYHQQVEVHDQSWIGVDCWVSKWH